MQPSAGHWTLCLTTAHVPEASLPSPWGPRASGEGGPCREGHVAPSEQVLLLLAGPGHVFLPAHLRVSISHLGPLQHPTKIIYF